MKSTNNDNISFLNQDNIVYSLPKFDCPKHGTIETIMTIYINEEKTVYCMQCYNEFLSSHIPVLSK